MKSLTCLRDRTSFVLVNATLILAMTGVPTCPQHSQIASQPSTSSVWSELQQSMQTMHQTMSSIQSTGSNDEDFIRLMIPHHQAAIDMAKAELMHGQDPQMRRLAQEIITDQESEIELMQLWLRQHDGQKSKPATSGVKEQ
jgi:uncharacterized protein (DUF305 family)